MFADDTNISYAPDSENELRNVLNSELKSLTNWLNTNGLSLNIAKTEFMTIGSRQKIITIDDEITNIKIKHVLLSCCIFYLEEIWRKMDF